LLENIKLSLSDSPFQQLDVLVNLLSGDLRLFLVVTGDPRSKVIPLLNTIYAANLKFDILIDDFRLFHVKSEVSSLLY
jgi:hypothetical protein